MLHFSPQLPWASSLSSSPLSSATLFLSVVPPLVRQHPHCSRTTLRCRWSSEHRTSFRSSKTLEPWTTRCLRSCSSLPSIATRSQIFMTHCLFFSSGSGHGRSGAKQPAETSLPPGLKAVITDSVSPVMPQALSMRAQAILCTKSDYDLVPTC